MHQKHSPHMQNWRGPISLSKILNVWASVLEILLTLGSMFSSLLTYKKRRPIWSSLDVSFSSPTTANKEQLFLAYFALNFETFCHNFSKVFFDNASTVITYSRVVATFFSSWINTTTTVTYFTFSTFYCE